mgnify:FL=1
MRKAQGTPFKLRSASPFKNEKTEDLGEMVNDKNHLVDVTKKTTTKEGGRLPTYKEAWEKDLEGIKNKYASYQDYVVDMSGIKKGDERDVEREAARDEAAKETKKVEYIDKEKPQPGSDGDMTDPFTSSEGRGQARYIKSQHRIARQAIKKNFRRGKMSREEYKQAMADNRDQQMRAQVAMAKNSYDQGNQGRNAYRSGEQIKYDHDMTKGSEGSDYTEASEEQQAELQNVDTLRKEAEGDGTPLKMKNKYGRTSGTPFRLRKY